MGRFEDARHMELDGEEPTYALTHRALRGLFIRAYLTGLGLGAAVGALSTWWLR